LSAELLRSILKDYIENKAKFTLGETSYGKIIEQSGGNLKNEVISDKNIGSFRDVAKKYDLSYALKADKTTNPPIWTVVISNDKSDKNNQDTFTRAFREFSEGILNAPEHKPSITRETLHLIEEVTQKKEQGERNVRQAEQNSDLWVGFHDVQEHDDI
jgi:hypothetical protein